MLGCRRAGPYHSDMSTDELRERFGDVGAFARVGVGKGGLTCVEIGTESAQATVYLHGAHLTHWRPIGQEEVLFLSGQSHFEGQKPIRGGVPVIFPWFGAKADDAGAPMHGFARTMEWTLEEIERDGEDVRVKMELESGGFGLSYTLRVGRTLRLDWETRNVSDRAMGFEQALHNYYLVGDVRKMSVKGLEGTTYLDKTDGFKRKVQEGNIRIMGETDRVYVGTQAHCVIEDPTMRRRIRIKKSGSETTVVWNPWIEKARAMKDFGDDEWMKMICVEVGNAAENAVRLEAGGVHQMGCEIAVERME